MTHDCRSPHEIILKPGIGLFGGTSVEILGPFVSEVRLKQKHVRQPPPQNAEVMSFRVWLQQPYSGC